MDTATPSAIELRLCPLASRSLGKISVGLNSVYRRRKRRAMAMPKAKEIVSANPVVVFSKSSCPFCVSVKKLLTELGANYKVIELDQEADGKEVQAALAEWTGQRTVPNVFIGGNHIGGCDTTTAMHGEGKLVPLLTQAGAVKAS